MTGTGTGSPILYRLEPTRIETMAGVKDDAEPSFLSYASSKLLSATPF